MSAPQNTHPTSTQQPRPDSTNPSAVRQTSVIQPTSRKRKWTKNSINDSDIGKFYERLITVATFLTLKDDQGMVCEMKEAGRFDDVVVCVENDGYYLRQIKHKQQSNFEIRESNLFPSKPKDTFSLDLYLTSFIKEICRNQPFAQDPSLMKELTLTTNVEFDPLLMQYLEPASPSKVWVPLSNKQQGGRYKFSPGKYNEIKKKLKKPNGFPSTDIDRFLSILVFEVKHPNLSDMKTLVKQKIRSLIPLELNDDQVEKASDMFQIKLKDFFDRLTGANDNWATTQLRQDILLDILTQLKDTVKIGSTLDFEGKSLLPIIQEINFSLDVPPEIQENLKTIIETDEFYCQNVVVSPEISLPVIVSSIIFSYFRRQKELDLRKLWMVDVKSEEDGLCLAHMFKHQNVKLFRNFIFVVEFSQELGENSVSKIVATIFDHVKKNQLLIKFIFIARQAIDSIPTKFQLFPKSKNHVFDFFTVETRTVLSEKPLLLKNSPAVSLSQLGIQLLNLDSLSVSELVLADAKSQLDLLLPFYDEEMEDTYVHRKLSLPVINTASIDANLKDRLCFDCNDYENKIKANQDDPIHLLISLESFKIPHENSTELFLLSKSNKVGIDELRGQIDKKSVQVDEDFMIRDNALFEKSHKIKAAVVVDLPGMGKSSLLTHLCNSVLKDLEKLKEDGSMRKLVVRVNLGICNRETWKLPLENEIDVIQFLCAYSQSNVSQGASDSKRLMRNLSQNILREILMGRSAWSIIIMLDGFDEISEVGREFIEKKLIRLLKPMEGLDRLIVASRPDGCAHKNLETCFNQFALHFLEFDSKDQENLLVALWRKTMKQNDPFPSIDKSRISGKCRAFAKKLIFEARKHLKDDDKTILDIPLQCKLFAECFYDDLKKYIQGSTSTLDTDGSFDILALFDKFFANKCHISYYGKRMLSGARNDREEEMYEEYNKSVTRKAMRVSVYYMTRDVEQAEKLLGEKWDRKQFEEDMAQLEKLGLVAYFNKDALDDGIATSFALLHRTFAEYLVAKYLIDAISDRNYFLLDDDCGDSILLNIVLIEKEYEGVKRFFSRMIRPLLPDITLNGCPFGSEDRRNVVKKWTILSNERSNDLLASKFMTDQQRDSFKMIIERWFTQVKRKDDIALLTLLITLITLCLKEHVARNLTKQYTNSLIKAFFEQTLFLFKFPLKSVEPKLKERAICYLFDDFFAGKEVPCIFFLWYIHSAQAEETKVRLNKYLFKSILAFLDSLYGFPDTSIVSLEALSFAVIHQKGFGLEKDQLNTILNRIFKEDDESCLASSCVLAFDVCLGNLASKFESWQYKKWLNAQRSNNNVEGSIAFFKKLLEIGSPEFHGGDTSLLEIQIKWFLSLGFRGEIFNKTLFHKKPFRKRPSFFERSNNPFFVKFVKYLLCTIDRYVKEEDKANDKRTRVMRIALQIDARILNLLNHERFSNDADNEDTAIRKAIEFVPKIHQAAHDGDVSIVTKLSKSKSDCHARRRRST